MLDQYLKPNVKRGATYDAIIGTVLGIVSIIPLLNCIALPLTCVSALALPLVIGWFVAQWGGASDTGKAAIDGAIATGVGHLVSGVIVLILTALLGVVFGAIGAATGSDTGSVAIGVAAGAAGSVFLLIFSVIFGVIFGAVGGLLYVAFQGSKKAAA